MDDARNELIELVKANPDICDSLLEFIKWMRENLPQEQTEVINETY